MRSLRRRDAAKQDRGRAAAPGPDERWGRVVAWYLRVSMTQVLVVIAALFVAIFLLTAQTVGAQRQARQGVMLQDEATLSLNALMEIMLDAETGQRGFLLTGNAAYLRPFQQAKARLGPEVGALQREGERGSDEERRHIARAQQLIGDKIAELDRTVELAGEGMMPSALALVRTNTGQRDMDELRIELKWLRANQARQRQIAFDRVQTLEDRLLPLVGLLGVVMILLEILALLGERHRAWAQLEARNFGALRAANAEAQVLARELNHRVKNLFSVVLSIISMSARKQAPVGEVLDDIRARVHALSLAHSSSQGLGVHENCQLGDLIANIMRPYADTVDDGGGVAGRVRLFGPAVKLPARMITPMGLLIHELATNSSKYGALGAATGIVEIDWNVTPAPEGAQSLQITWIERGGPALSIQREDDVGEAASVPKSGFGARLIAMAARQMGGSVQRTWPSEGARIGFVCLIPGN